MGDCDCPVCTDHHLVHDQSRMLVAGRAVEVDAALVPLVERLAQRALMTVASCQDLRGAVLALWPERMASMTTGTQPRVNYRRVLTEGLAYLRVLAAPEALAEVKALTLDCGGEWLTLGPLVQVAFPLDLVQELEVAV